MTPIDTAAAAEFVQSSLLPQLRGLLLFARSLAFGRCGGAALRSLGLAIQTSGPTVSIRGQLAVALFNLRQHLLTSRPREIRVDHKNPPLIFTDGAFEHSTDGVPHGGIGGILVDFAADRYEYFSLNLKPTYLKFLLGSAAKTIIFELEVLPVFVARRLWSEQLADRSILVFVDNESAKAALISSYSANPHVVNMLTALAEVDSRDGGLPWYERVPTAANPADLPSRGERPPRLHGLPAPLEVAADTITEDFLDEQRSLAVNTFAGTDLDPRVFSSGVAD